MSLGFDPISASSISDLPVGHLTAQIVCRGNIIADYSFEFGGTVLMTGQAIITARITNPLSELQTSNARFVVAAEIDYVGLP